MVERSHHEPSAHVYVHVHSPRTTLWRRSVNSRDNDFSVVTNSTGQDWINNFPGRLSHHYEQEAHAGLALERSYDCPLA